MNVATFSFERTLHSHLRTPKTSRGTSTFIGCLTATWQARRVPAAASRLVTCEASVGSSEPPPSSTFTLHCPQVPPPPQAEETYSSASASAPSSLPPTGTFDACAAR